MPRQALHVHIDPPTRYLPMFELTTSPKSDEDEAKMTLMTHRRGTKYYKVSTCSICQRKGGFFRMFWV